MSRFDPHRPRFDPHRPFSSVLKSAYHTKSYTGHEALADVDLVHMNGRVYDPVLGRFMSADPFVQFAFNSQSYNRYSYVLNNPLGATDPTGYYSVSETIDAVVEGAKETWNDFKSAFGGDGFSNNIGTNPETNGGHTGADINGNEPEFGAANGGDFDGDGDSDNDGIPDSIDDEENVEGIVDPAIKGPALHPGGAPSPGSDGKSASQKPPSSSEVPPNVKVGQNRAGKTQIKITNPDGSVKIISADGVKVDLLEPRAKKGKRAEKFHNAIPGTKGKKRLPTQEELDLLKIYGPQ